MSDLEHLLTLSPNDVLALSLRAKLRGNSGDLEGAREDLAETNLAVRNDLAYRSRMGDGECDLEYLVRFWTFESVCYRTDATSSLKHRLEDGLTPVCVPSLIHSLC